MEKKQLTIDFWVWQPLYDSTSVKAQNNWTLKRLYQVNVFTSLKVKMSQTHTLAINYETDNSNCLS